MPFFRPNLNGFADYGVYIRETFLKKDAFYACFTKI